MEKVAAVLGGGRRWGGGRKPDREALLVITLVCRQAGVDADMLMHRSRCVAEVAFARQLAMYLMNVVLQKSMTDVGILFGRDRTTVRHACAVIEDRREDRAFDEGVTRLEDIINAAIEANRHQVLHAVA
jgi:chromosomal replication initiation ATPase DnaA